MFGSIWSVVRNKLLCHRRNRGGTVALYSRHRLFISISDGAPISMIKKIIPWHSRSYYTLLVIPNVMRIAIYLCRSITIVIFNEIGIIFIKKTYKNFNVVGFEQAPLWKPSKPQSRYVHWTYGLVGHSAWTVFIEARVQIMLR